jgi:tetratricopeptide (TPR) repeat protein
MLVLPYFLLVVAFALVNNEILKKTGVIAPYYSSFLAGYEIRIYTALRAIFYYFKMLLVPFPLLMFHPFDFSKSFVEPTVILSLLGLLLLGAAGYALRKSAPAVSFALGWSLISLLPVIGLIPSNTLIAERYLFLPAAGFAIVAGACIRGIMARGGGLKVTAIVMTCAVLTSYSAIIYKRNFDWKDNVTLIMANIRDVPNKPSLYYLAGSEYFARGDNERTLFYMKKAADMNAFYGIHYSVYATIIAYQENRLTEALAILDRTQNSFKLYVRDVNYLYGKIHQSLGDREKAALYYRNAQNSSMPLGVFSADDVAKAMASLM